MNLQMTYDLWHAAHASTEWRRIQPVEGRGKIPDFQDKEELARFWDTHDFTDYAGDTEECDDTFKRPYKARSNNRSNERSERPGQGITKD